MLSSLARIWRPYRMPGTEEICRLRSFFAGVRSGYFVDVGANAVGHYSQHFELDGWNGILVEPLPDLAEKLRQERTAKVVECLVGSPEESGQTHKFYRGIHTGHSTLHPENRVGSEYGYDEAIERPLRTLDSILEEHDAPPGFEFLKIDVESHELQVARGFDFARWAPQLVVVEDHAFDLRLHRYITSQEYRYFQRVNLNTWYVPDGSEHRTPPAMHYAFFRKFYLGLPARIVIAAIARVIQRRQLP